MFFSQDRRRRSESVGLCSAMLLLCSAEATASEGNSSGANIERQYHVTQIASRLVYPWSIAILPNGELLVTEKPGRLRFTSNGVIQSQPALGIPRVVNLLDVVLHPSFQKTHWIYLSYTKVEGKTAALEVVRGRLAANRLIEQQVIFRATPGLSHPLHFGGRLLFLPDRTLLISIGDGSPLGERAQDYSSTLGSVVRVADDGAIPHDNPSAHRSDVRSELFTKGHRNIQGIALRSNGEIWSHEHGPIGGDELNMLIGGANYGWPIETRGQRGFAVGAFETAPAMSAPLYSWTPAIAPSGLAFYRGEAFPQWKGDLFVGSLTQKRVLRLTLAGHEVVAQKDLLVELHERIRDVRVHTDGFLYVLTDSIEGQVLRVEPAT